MSEVPMARSKGRSGRPWRRVREQVLAGQPVCYLCGHAIDKTLPATDPLSATVDHVIPLAHGGQERDPANLRPAHLRCNSRKGASDSMPQPTTSRAW